VASHGFKMAEWVRVKPDCPHTLPAYARLIKGMVVDDDDEDFVQVNFGEGRTFPIPPECLEHTDPPENADEL
jgi:hypothetical protein